MKIPFNELRNRSQSIDKRFEGCFLSLDPGHTTGYAVWNCTKEEIKIAESGQLSTWIDNDLGIKMFRDILIKYQPKIVVLETYQVYEWKSADHSWSQIPTVQVIGMIKTLCQLEGITYHGQTAQVAKQFCTDEKLEDWGLWIKGMKHARDAIRHGCYYLLFRP
jgi:hypothetical protein